MTIKQKMITGILSVGLMAGAVSTAMASFAASTNVPQKTPSITREDSGKFHCPQGARPAFDDNERRAEMEKLHTKWNHLNTDQKEVIYQLEEKKWDLELEMIDKYLAFELIDQNQADEAKKIINERKNGLRNDARMPMIIRDGKEGRPAPHNEQIPPSMPQETQKN